MKYLYEEFPLIRNGITLHLDRIMAADDEAKRNILLIHGVTYSSHEFDVDYKDYSLVRRLALAGYGVWRLDIAGYGRSGQVDDGFMPDSVYASEDIQAAVLKICEISKADKIDILGWSWGTITTAKAIAAGPEHVRKYIMLAPILRGLKKAVISEPFHHNSWEHAAEDFQRDQDGHIDYSVVEKTVVEILCSNCWRYDGEYSPNGGRRDCCCGKDKILIQPESIRVQTLIICGDRDPYVDQKLVTETIKKLPAGSRAEVIEGASHVVLLEKPYYHDFQERVISFLYEK